MIDTTAHLRRVNETEKIIMNLNEYQMLALRTDTARPDLRYYVLQIFCEAAEVLNIYVKSKYHGHPLDVKKLLNELGDLMWYIAVFSHKNNISLQNLALISEVPDMTEEESYVNSSSRAADILMTYVRLEKGHISSLRALEDLKSHLSVLFGIIKHLADKHGSMDIVLEGNIRKLKVRYPDGYSDLASINRNVEAEDRAVAEED